MKPDQINLTIADAAKRARTGKDNIKRLIDEGKLGVVAYDKLKKNILVPIAELDRFNKENTRWA